MEQHNEDIGTKKDLCLYRIQTAKDNLKAAKILFDVKEYKSANNRAYYAIFQALNAVHALDGNSYKRHKDAIANFNKTYVKNEIFPEKQEERQMKQRKFVMQVIMTISILQAWKKQSVKYLLQANLFVWWNHIVESVLNNFKISSFVIVSRVEISYGFLKI